MAKLSVEFLEAKIAEANKKGVHKFDLMTIEELAAYKENCVEAIEGRKIKVAKSKGVIQRIQQETIEVLEGYIAYIDAKLNEQPEKNGEEIIDTFLANWREKAYKVYTELKSEYNAIEGIKAKNTFLWKLTKSAAQIITYPGFEPNLNRTLDFAVKEKKMLLMSRITKTAGEIIDATGLHLGDNGEINGTIVGDKKTVTVKTIMAGGHSIQCLHYRVLVK